MPTDAELEIATRERDLLANGMPSGLARYIAPRLDLPLDASLVSLLDADADFVRDFGAVGDGSADNSTQLIAFNAWARIESDAGRGVTLRVPPGVYNFDHKLCYGFLFGIKKLRVVAYGAAFQNTYDRLIQGSQSGFELPFSPNTTAANKLTVGYQIDTAAVGDTSVTLKTPSDTSSLLFAQSAYPVFVVGRWILIGSMDIQGYGQPVNLDRFDFVKITSINPITGVIGFTPALKNDHRDDFPDWLTSRTGKARIFPLDASYASPDNRYIPWDIEHVLEGMEIRLAPNANIDYHNISGQHVKLINVTTLGPSESTAERIEYEGCHFTTTGESDKLVDSISYSSCLFDGATGFQSSSINRVSYRDCKMPHLFRGAAKTVFAANCDMDLFSAGSIYGMGRSAVLIGCCIRDASLAAVPLRPFDTGLTVDGVNVIYANGVFSMPRASNNPVWNMIPGMRLNWCVSPSQAFSGDIGSMVVTRCYDDATYLFFETTCPFASVPSWSNGQIRMERAGSIQAIDCYGGDDIRRMSESTKLGIRTGGYFKDTFLGQWSQGGYWLGRAGKLTRLVVNVIQATAVATTQLELYTNMITTDALNDSKAFDCIIDVTVAGRRDFDLAALTGKETNDAVTLNAVAQTELPANRTCIGATFNWLMNHITMADYEPNELPIVEVEMWFDPGIYNRPLPAHLSYSGAVIAAVTGGL